MAFLITKVVKNYPICILNFVMWFIYHADIVKDFYTWKFQGRQLWKSKDGFSPPSGTVKAWSKISNLEVIYHYPFDLKIDRRVLDAKKIHNLKTILRKKVEIGNPKSVLTYPKNEHPVRISNFNFNFEFLDD